MYREKHKNKNKTSAHVMMVCVKPMFCLKTRAHYPLKYYKGLRRESTHNGTPAPTNIYVFAGIIPGVECRVCNVCIGI